MSSERASKDGAGMDEMAERKGGARVAFIRSLLSSSGMIHMGLLMS